VASEHRTPAKGGWSDVTRFVIAPDAAMLLADRQVAVREEHRLLAPTLLRSQMLSLLYQAVRRGEMTQRQADRQLDFVRGLRIRLLGDRVLQRNAWRVADQLDWSTTLDAEYVALTLLHADAFVTLDAQLTAAVRGLVTVAGIDDLL
jgi:predicted nucleic acid-binding protein